jgi:hypothetical protein
VVRIIGETGPTDSVYVRYFDTITQFRSVATAIKFNYSSQEYNNFLNHCLFHRQYDVHLQWMSMESSELETNVGIHIYSTEGGFIFNPTGQQTNKKKKTIINTNTLILQGTNPKRI